MKPHYKYEIEETGHSSCYTNRRICMMAGRRTLLSELRKGHIFGKAEACIYYVNEQGKKQLIERMEA